MHRAVTDLAWRLTLVTAISFSENLVSVLSLLHFFVNCSITGELKQRTEDAMCSHSELVCFEHRENSR